MTSPSIVQPRASKRSEQALWRMFKRFSSKMFRTAPSDRDAYFDRETVEESEPCLLGHVALASDHGAPVIFQDVVHSKGTREADCDEQSSFRGPIE